MNINKKTYDIINSLLKKQINKLTIEYLHKLQNVEYWFDYLHHRIYIFLTNFPKLLYVPLELYSFYHHIYK